MDKSYILLPPPKKAENGLHACLRRRLVAACKDYRSAVGAGEMSNRYFCNENYNLAASLGLHLSIIHICNKLNQIETKNRMLFPDGIKKWLPTIERSMDTSTAVSYTHLMKPPIMARCV